jgi:3-deoxy-D-manno-octulosonic acid kinase
MDAGSLYEYAASRPTVRVMHGRAPVYATCLPDGGPSVVVRRSRHGGLLAPLTGDRFLGRTRAPRELAMSLRLQTMGIPTPTLVAYVVYSNGPVFRRSDVATMLIEPSADLAAVLRGDGGPIGRDAAIAASADLLVAMARGGVRHPDLNLKNILIAATPGTEPRAYLIDIDRARIEEARARAASANAARLVRSARRWRERHGVPISDAEVAVLDAAALGRPQ